MKPSAPRTNNPALFLALAVLACPAARAADSANTFARFLGDWKLKDDRFQQVWDGKTVETLNIPAHRTHCAPVNTDRSVLCVVDAGELKGHIFWAFDGESNQVHHLSHFAPARTGVGTGALDAQGNLRLTLRFQGEPAGSYRVYEYTWVSNDEYSMKSRQYSADGALTGNWYGGSFIRTKARN